MCNLRVKFHLHVCTFTLLLYLLLGRRSLSCCLQPKLVFEMLIISTFLLHIPWMRTRKYAQSSPRPGYSRATSSMEKSHLVLCYLSHNLIVGKTLDVLPSSSAPFLWIILFPPTNQRQQSIYARRREKEERVVTFVSVLALSFIGTLNDGWRTRPG